MRSAASQSIHLGRALVLLMGLSATLASVRCYAPTQVTVSVTTDLDCAQTIRTAIHVGTDGTAPEAETSACTGAPPRSEIGTLVVVPTEDRDGKATVRVVLATGGKSPETCVSGSLDCVVASRSFSFIEHKGLRLPIQIFKECLGKVCAANETCVAGARCVSNDVGCTGDGCDLRAPDSDGGGPPIVDVPDASDGGPIVVDAAPTQKCLGPNGNGIVTTAANMPSYRLAAASKDAFFFTDNDGVPKSLEFVKVAKATGLRTVLGPAAGTIGSSPLVIAVNRDGVGMFGRVVSVGGPTNTQSVMLEGAMNAPFVVPSTIEDGMTDIAGPVTPNGALFYALTTSRLWFSAGGPVSELIVPGGTRVAADNSTLYIADKQQILAYKLESLSLLAAIPLIPAPVLDGPAFAFNGTTLFVGGMDSSQEKVTIRKLDGAVSTEVLPAITGAPISLAADATHVYWTDGTTVRRAGHQGNGGQQVVVTAPNPAQLNHLSVDDDCLYYWLGPTGTPAELHVTPKQP